jgi:hypothetical protein
MKAGRHQKRENPHPNLVLERVRKLMNNLLHHCYPSIAEQQV